MSIGKRIPIIGSMATMPSRSKTFPIALKSILPQVDLLFVFLDGFEEIPLVLRGCGNCHITVLPKDNDLHSSSRFLAPQLYGEDALACFFDDDIVYPENYTERLVNAITELEEKALVGFHGTVFLPPCQSYVRDRLVFHFSHELNKQLNVHELGSGTVAFLTSVFSPKPELWRFHNMDDLCLAAEAQLEGLPKKALKRPANWLKPLEQNQEDSLWRATKRDDSIHSEFMRYILSRDMKSNEFNWRTGN